MISLKKRDQGFTIIELLVVIVVIAILALIVITTYSGIQSKARDVTRQSDLKTLQSQIETFYSANGYYPNLTDLNSSTWRAAHMKTLSADNLVDPSSSCNPSTSSCLVGTVPTRSEHAYGYVATASDGVTSCNGAIGSGADQNCAEYKLYTNLENNVNGSTQDVLQSLEQ
jgi:prepilin-type N-terminal cleavage/methylation domain-containing protein